MNYARYWELAVMSGAPQMCAPEKRANENCASSGIPSLLCYIADFLHWLLQCALCCYQTAKARTLCVYIARRADRLHWYSSLQMTFAFKTRNQIRQFFPLCRRFYQKYLYHGNYFLSHNVCLYDIYQYLWRHAVFFKPKKVITEKL